MATAAAQPTSLSVTMEVVTPGVRSPSSPPLTPQTLTFSESRSRSRATRLLWGQMARTAVETTMVQPMSSSETWGE